MTEPAQYAGATLPPPHAGWRTAVLALLVALAAMILVLCVFCPRFGVWGNLSVPKMRFLPEIIRAVATEQQLRSPFVILDDPSNQVIHWRLLFPVVWHYLNLPLLGYLILPFLGCVLTLWATAWWTYQRIGRWWPTWLAVVLFAALPWFFVSTGWLTYFDSWLVLGLLLTAFDKRGWVLALVCLASPWVDERFVLALPVTFVFRALTWGWLPEIPWRWVKRDALLATVGVAPYLVVRLAAIVFFADQQTGGYVQRHWDDAHQVAWTRYLLGGWSGYRLAWVGLVVVAIVGWRLGGRLWGTLLVLVGLGTTVMGLFIAADLSRDMMMLAPGVVLAVWLGYQYRPAVARWALPVIVAGNLLLPAQHVLWGMVNSIHSLPREIARFRLVNEGQLQGADPDDVVMYAKQLITLNAYADAANALTAVLQKDPQSDTAYYLRVEAWLGLHKPALALPDIQKAIALQPQKPDYRLVRAVVYSKLGERELARRDLVAVLEMTPANWPMHASCADLLRRFYAGTQPGAGATSAPAASAPAPEP